MKYLHNKLIEFNPLFEINYKIKKPLICCSLFKRDSSYYKDFSIYISGLSKLYFYVIKNHSNYSIRLFIDNSIYKDEELMKSLKKLEKLEIVVYDCPLFKIDNFHQGLFGTLIRFCPMFDFPNNDASTIILSDIDTFFFKKHFEIFKLLKYKIKDDKIQDLYLIKFSNAGKMFYNKDKYNKIYNNVILDYGKTNEFICLKQIDYNIMIDFLENLDTNIRYTYYTIEKKENETSEKYIYSHNSKFSKNNGHFIYGVDEYFLNNHYLPYFIKNKKPFLDILNFNILNIFYCQANVNARSEYWLIKNKIIFNELLNLIISKIKKSNSIKKNKNITNKNISNEELLNKFNFIESGNEKKKLINKNILYNIFLKIKDKKKYSFMINSIYNKLLTSDKYYNLYEFIEFQFHFININNFFIKSHTFNIQT